MAAIQASNLFFTPLPPSHVVQPGKEIHGRYMLTIPWNRVSGWGQPKIGPRADLSFDPLAGVLQYAVTCFEGMKCYKSEEGKLRLFRPTKNFDRLKNSGARLGLPTDWDNEELLVLFQRLLALEAPIVPATDGASLYIRPTLLETSEGFGIKEDGYAADALLYVVTTLNLGLGLYGSAEADGKGLKLHADKNFVRAWPGGTGNYKVGANYGTHRTVNIAKQPGYAMSLWLHGEEDFISEAGAMNMAASLLLPRSLLEFVTMPLSSGIVLPGITRASLIELLTDHASGKADFPVEGVPKNIRVVERDISMGEIVAGLKDGSVKGMFGCGTGVVVVSIQHITYSGTPLTIPYHPVTKILRDTVTGLQRGRISDGGREWGVEVPEWEGVCVAEKEGEREEVFVA
ncbi:hypothetical protein I350_07086 [Cryptococcus amylolentus CBS 6273]|uniref:Branched-chain-amino-acid transaminase n=1 Tax=Cryptococcus amylolentus CBS 6273 TaxID=1296118 RepID=A0A1E3JHY2_9TREE|nr:hypothetical protein I350_07086 [Cryptococcus amylolentus CBS 6273]